MGIIGGGDANPPPAAAAISKYRVDEAGR